MILIVRLTFSTCHSLRQMKIARAIPNKLDEIFMVMMMKKVKVKREYNYIFIYIPMFLGASENSEM